MELLCFILVTKSSYKFSHVIFLIEILPTASSSQGSILALLFFFRWLWIQIFDTLDSTVWTFLKAESWIFTFGKQLLEYECNKYVIFLKTSYFYLSYQFLHSVSKMNVVGRNNWRVKESLHVKTNCPNNVPLKRTTKKRN